jgi:hypothetical protein
MQRMIYESRKRTDGGFKKIIKKNACVVKEVKEFRGQ